MSYVQICTGLCASPDIIETAANNLRELVVEREQKWDLMEAENQDSAYRRKVENKYLSDAMGKLIQIAAVTRCLLYTSPSPRDGLLSRMPSSA